MPFDNASRIEKYEYLLRTCKEREKLGATMFDGCRSCPLWQYKDPHLKVCALAALAQDIDDVFNIMTGAVKS